VYHNQKVGVHNHQRVEGAHLMPPGEHCGTRDVSSLNTIISMLITSPLNPRGWAIPQVLWAKKDPDRWQLVGAITYNPEKIVSVTNNKDKYLQPSVPI
jgi:hypothetical protein